ncbi:hypothetical protein Ddc_18643 [Ditylenchus destructor]|nr:hypothetical protein Ddc_18643 [Ditylenchus destructor]
MKCFILLFITFGFASADKECEEMKVYKACLKCQAELADQLDIYESQPDVDHDTKYRKLCSLDQEAVKCYHKVYFDECGEEKAKTTIKAGCHIVFSIPDSPDECKQLKALRERGGV